MLAQKSKYALRALLVLAKEYGQGPVLISDIAHREALPHKFLELILLELRNHGILGSKKGKGGGYFLARGPSWCIWARFCACWKGLSRFCHA